MRAHPPIPRAANRAFSLVELLVSVGLLSIVILALYAMFDQTQRALRGSVGQVDVLEGARSAIDLVRRDLEQARPAGVLDGPHLVTRVSAAPSLVLNQTSLFQERQPVLQEFFGIRSVADRQWGAFGYFIADESNPTLRTMFQKARDASVPMDTIERAIKRGTGELDGVNYESINYEGYAPSGVAVYVDALTDNRNRTGAEIRSVFSKQGGSLAEPGAVAWQFERTGVVLVDGSVDEDELMLVALDAGASDITRVDDLWQVTCDPSSTSALRQAVEGAGMDVRGSDLTMLPSSTVELDSVEAARAVLRLIDALDDHDDVQDVYANAEISDEILGELGD